MISKDTNGSNLLKRKPIASIAVGILLATAVGNYEGFKDTSYYATEHEKKVGISTIGYGSTRHPDGTAVKPGETITRKQAAEYMQHDLESYKQLMLKCVKVPLMEYEFNAYASLTYTIGPTAFCNSTLVKKLNAGDYPGACQQILRWDKQNGVVIKGLTIRRKQEYSTCLGKGYRYAPN